MADSGSANAISYAKFLSRFTRCCDSHLRFSWQRDRNARARGRVQRAVVACNRWIPLASLSVPIKPVRLSPMSSCEGRGRRRKCTWEKCHLPSSLFCWPCVSGSDTGRRTRIYRLFFLSSGSPPSLRSSHFWSNRSVLKKSRRLVKPILQPQISNSRSQTRSAFRPHDNETLPVAAMRVSNEDRSPVGINS